MKKSNSLYTPSIKDGDFYTVDKNTKEVKHLGDFLKCVFLDYNSQYEEIVPEGMPKYFEFDGSAEWNESTKTYTYQVSPNKFLPVRKVTYMVVVVLDDNNNFTLYNVKIKPANANNFKAFLGYFKSKRLEPLYCTFTLSSEFATYNNFDFYLFKFSNIQGFKEEAMIERVQNLVFENQSFSSFENEPQAKIGNNSVNENDAPF
jgi:hypothetical protein